MKNAFSNSNRSINAVFLFALGISFSGAFIGLIAAQLKLPLTALALWYTGLAVFLVLLGIGVFAMVCAVVRTIRNTSSSLQPSASSD